MKLQKAVDLFLSSKTNPNTRNLYYYILLPMAQYLGPARPVDKITPVEMVQYANQIKNSGHAEATNRRDLKSIRTFFNWLVMLEEIPRSPAAAFKVPRASNKADRSKAMTDGEFLAILDYAKWKPRDYALILFLADTGCRAGGAASLKIQDLRLADRAAAVTEKGDKTRRVQFGEECARALDAWLLVRLGDLGPFVFQRRGKRLTSASLSQVVERACLKALGYSRGAHSLRHRKGHQMADARIPITVAAIIMGHESELTTLAYYPKDWSRAKEVLDELSYKPTSREKPRIIQLPKAGND